MVSAYPDTPDDPTENEIAGAADKLETMMNGSQPQANIFYQPDNLGALPAFVVAGEIDYLVDFHPR